MRFRFISEKGYFLKSLFEDQFQYNPGKFRNLRNLHSMTQSEISQKLCVCISIFTVSALKINYYEKLVNIWKLNSVNRYSEKKNVLVAAYSPQICKQN